MYTTIAYKLAAEGENLIRIYDDSTEYSFVDHQDAINYAAYLLAKGFQYVDTYEKTLFQPGELNIEELKKQDALDKLTDEEKRLLGLNP